MDEIRRLLRVAARRNSASEYSSINFRTLKKLRDRFRVVAAEDNISPNVVIEACMRGYVERHPAVLAMIDEWIRRERPEPPERKAPKMSRRDLDEIYAAAKDGMTSDEE